MTEKLKELFAELDRYWNIPDKCKGLHPGCHETQDHILREFAKMDAESVRLILHHLTDGQLEQIVPIVEEIIAAFPSAADTFLNINASRDIYWLNDELCILGLKEK